MQNEGRSRLLIMGIVLGLIGSVPLLALSGYLYLRYGDPPVATADKPFPFEKTIVHIPLDARVKRQLFVPPLTATPDNLAAGAKVYVAHCAVCHGAPGRNRSFGLWEYPTAPQLWTKYPNGAVGVSDDPVPVSYWKVDNGIRLTGMPSFQHILSQTEEWQVSLLLSQANQQQAAAVADTLTAYRESQQAQPQH